MKTTREVAKEFKAVINQESLSIYSECLDWNFYMTFTGFNNEDEYFSVYIMESICGIRKISIGSNTKNFNEIINTLKEIEPAVTIEYTNEAGEEKTV
tara:strand:+ start:345 stop:635 length:291 start_codon:yes stop_codon:yes gene_type:complete